MPSGCLIKISNLFIIGSWTYVLFTSGVTLSNSVFVDGIVFNLWLLVTNHSKPIVGIMVTSGTCQSVVYSQLVYITDAKNEIINVPYRLPLHTHVPASPVIYPLLPFQPLPRRLSLTHTWAPSPSIGLWSSGLCGVEWLAPFCVCVWQVVDCTTVDIVATWPLPSLNPSFLQLVHEPAIWTVTKFFRSAVLECVCVYNAYSLNNKAYRLCSFHRFCITKTAYRIQHFKIYIHENLSLITLRYSHELNKQL